MRFSMFVCVCVWVCILFSFIVKPPKKKHIKCIMLNIYMKQVCEKKNDDMIIYVFIKIDLYK